MASTVFQLNLRVILFTLTIATATFPTCADQNEKLIVKTTPTPSPYNDSKKAANSKGGVEVGNHTAIKPLKEEMETVTSESTSMAAHCSFEETGAVDLGALLDAGEGALVTLMAGETRLTAHRAVLAARSPAFAAMLCHNTQDASSGQVAIPDVEGPVLRHLLAYLYTLQAPQLPGMASQLLAAADRLGLSALKSECEVQLAAQLAVETAAATAVLAIRHSSTSLRQAAITFIRAHVVQVIATKGWADAVRYQPEDVIEVYRLLAKQPSETSPHNASLCSTPAAAGSQPTTGAQSQRQTPVATAPPTPTRHTTPPGVDATSRLRTLSAEEKGRRLIEAAKEGAVGDFETFLAAVADVGARDVGMNTALHWAAAGGHAEVVRRLLWAGVEVDARNSVQVTPLFWAAYSGHKPVVQLLIRASANIEARQKEKWTPLHFAARYGHTAVVQLLVASSADTEARQQDRWTPLHFAARYGHVAVVQLLIASSADIETRNKDGWSPLHLAARNGQAQVAAALLAAGADRGSKTNKGNSPLDLARQQKKQQLIDMLT